MQKIILLSGHSQRFLNEGFTVKPLISIDQKLIIDYVIESIKSNGEENFNNYIFIVKKSDIINYKIDSILLEKFPQSRVISIDDHRNGPVFSIKQIFNLIDDNSEVVISYCDLYIKWNFDDFILFARESQSDGSIVSHINFHPHRINNQYFAYLKVDNNKVLQIKEKSYFTDDPDSEYASGGIYFFKKGSYVKKYFQHIIDIDDKINNEFYVTLVYNHMIKDNLNITHFDSKNYVCLGTPMDVKIFQSFLTINKFIPLEMLIKTANYFKQYE
jgi:NDP-sugar pyrophosphorylase family protein